MQSRVAIVGDTPTWRRGVAAILSDSGFVPVELGNLSEWKRGRGGKAVIAAVSEPLVLDHIRRFCDEHPKIPVVAVLAELTVSAYANAVHAGATAALGEQEPAEELVLVLETALRGRAAVPEPLVRAMAARIPISPKPEAWLEPGQADWLRHLSRGEPISDLADNVGYSEREMFRMLHDLYVRIGVRNRTEAIIWATRHGVLDEEADAD